MKKIALNLFALGLLIATSQTAGAQSALLAEMYGRGVHAYNAGMLEESLQQLTMAIDNSIQDPRAYYFRGMIYRVTGRPEQAKSDWQAGAKMEAAGRINGSIGRSLSRLQGSARIELESIRQQAKVEAMAAAIKRSKERYGELDAASAAAAAPVPPTGNRPLVPPVPPTGATNPFVDDMVQGKPQVVSDDAFAGALKDPFAGQPNAAPAGGAAAPAANPFGGGGAAAGADPFGGGGAGAGADPFGGGGASDAGADPFGGGGADPFGGGGADPFGGGADPFGS
ncbi:MAG: hypothetical protein VYA84_19245 [Planctomycetota bacterium]|nr:hypothetical protein [Planctomycetota bacterium]